MQIVTYSDFRKKLASFLTDVSENHEPVFITRKGGEDAVLISKKDFESYEETAYLLSNSKNAKRLLDSVEKAKKGSVKERKLIKP